MCVRGCGYESTEPTEGERDRHVPVVRKAVRFTPHDPVARDAFDWPSNNFSFAGVEDEHVAYSDGHVAELEFEGMNCAEWSLGDVDAITLCIVEELGARVVGGKGCARTRRMMVRAAGRSFARPARNAAAKRTRAA